MIVTMKVKKNYNADDAIDSILDGNQSVPPGRSSDEEKNDEIEDAVQNNVSDDVPTDAAETGDDISLAPLAGASNQASFNDQGQARNEPVQRVYCWRKRDTIVCDH